MGRLDMHVPGCRDGGVTVRACCSLLLLLLHPMLLLLLCTGCCCCSAQVYNLSLSVDEGLPPGTLVGDIRAGLPEGSSGEGFFLSEEGGESPVLRDLQVDTETGIVRTLRALDRERRGRYSFVAATLRGEVVQVEIRVRDVNDHPPAFPTRSVRLQVSELTPPGTTFRLPPARDPDTGEHGLRGYTLRRGSQGAAFTIRYGEGKQGAGELGRARAGWGQEGGRTGLRHGDGVKGEEEVGGEGAVMSQGAVGEEGAGGALEVWASEAAEVANETVGAGLEFGNSEELQEAKGKVGELDANWEDLRDWVAGDSEGQDYGVGTVAEQQENVPQGQINWFGANAESPEYGVYADTEGQEVGTDSEEEGQVEGAGLDPTLHPLDLVLMHWLDREELDRYQLEVEAFDGGHPCRTGRLRVDITVLDANDNPPTFDRAEYMGWVWESAPPGTPICTVHATDPDLGSNGEVSYSLRSGEGYFTVEESSGVVQVNRPLDREQRAIHQLVVQARDGGAQPEVSSILVTVRVLDVNDNNPHIHITLLTDSGQSEVSEGARSGEYLARISVSDPDLESEEEPGGENDGEGKEMQEWALRGQERGEKRQERLKGGQEKEDRRQEIKEKGREDQVQGEIGRVEEVKVQEAVNIGERDGGKMGQSLSHMEPERAKEQNKNPQKVGAENIVDGRQGHEEVQESVVYGKHNHQNVSGRLGEQQQHVSSRLGEQQQVSVTLEGGEGLFSLRPAGPQLFFLCVEGPLDRELQDLYELRLVAWDSGSPPLQSHRTLLLRVTDLNDQPPIFHQPDGYHATISEAASAGTVVLRLSTQDLDEDGPNSSVTYTLQDSPSSVAFLLDPHTGVLSIARTLDHEAEPVLNLVVVATDNGSPPLSSSCPVTIMVEDINDNEPVFLQQFYNVSLQEHTPIGYCFLQVKATDADSGSFGQIQYSIYDGFHSSKESPAFRIDPDAGRICVSQDIDREGEPGMYDLLVKARDEGGLSAQAFVRIEIEDINDNAPTFDPTSYVTSISSHTQPGTEILNVMATDIDDGIFGEVTYELIPGDFSALFTIDSSTGMFYVISTLAQLEASRVSVSVSARDRGGLASAVNAAVTVNILKTAVAPAVFEKSRYTFSIAEDVPIGSAVGTVKAREPLNSLEPISYKILSGDPHEIFTINTQFGIIRTKKQLDYETQPLVVLTVQSQLGSSSVYSSTQVNITLTDVNDNPPIFPAENEGISIYQNTAPGTALYIAHAEDIDSGYNGLISYSIASEKQDMFIIDPNIGILYLNSTLTTDYEQTLLIMAEDNGHPILSSLLTLTISVEKQVVVNALTFLNLVHQIEISEGFPMYTRILQVKAFIQGTPSPTSKIVYSLYPVVDSTTFGIHRSSGWVFLRRPLDYENTKIYNLKVVASSIEDGVGQTATTSVIVNILDENDNFPTFSHAISFFTVDESSVPHGVIGTIRALDRDSGKNGQLSYFLLSEGNYFLISSKTGEIINCAALDHEQETHHQLSVLVTDHGTPRRNATTTVYIKISDLNDNKPYFPQFPTGKQLYVKVLEAQPEHMLVATVYAKDPDAGINGTVVYSLSSDDGSGHFIINARSGEIWTTQALSSNHKAQYRLIVTASDQGAPPLQEEVFINIQIIPTLKEKSNTLLKVKNFKVLENSEPPQLIGSVKSREDHLLSNKKVHYQISNEEHNGHFVIDGSTGDVYLSRQLDYETNSHYVLSVNIQDHNKIPPQNYSVFLKIDIEDQNDHIPLFLDHIVVVGIEENVPTGTLVHTFKAKDGDGSLLNSKVKYSLNTDDAAENPFLIHEWEGALTTAMELDRETMESFVLTVIATDQAANITDRRASSLTARIVIQDINDNRPHFISLPLASVMEDADVGSLIHHIVAEDPDEGKNGKITFHITEGNEKHAFMLETTTGWLTLCSPIDREFQNHYILIILAMDDGTPVLSATQTLTVTVIDVNDEAPTFKQPLYEAVIRENQAPGEYVMKVEAEDTDSGINSVLTFHIIPGTGHGLFRINSETGELVTAAKLDREEQEFFTIKVLVTDGGFPSLSSTTTIICTVLDENDNAPEFLLPDVDIQVLENQDLGIIHTALAVDKDAGNNGSVQFQIIGGNTGGYLAINNTSGEIWATRSLDREDVSNFTIIVECHDLGSPRKSTTAKLNIIVLDENDNPPTFSKSQYRTSVREDLTIGSVVLNLLASDLDEGLSGEIVYSLIDATQGVLTINSTTGSIVTARALDRELKHQYVFRVVASDCSIHGPKSATVKVLVYIEDVNDNSPVFVENLVHALVSPNTLVNKTIATISASDLDLGLNGTVVFNLAESDPFFHISRQTGEVQLQKPLPSDSFRSTVLKVVASDLGVPARTVTGLVAIYVQGLEKEISFVHNVYEAIILENSEAGTTVVTVEAQHHNSKGESIHYTIFSGDEEEAFSLNSVTGEITVKEPGFLDFEVRKKVNLIVSAENSGHVIYCRVTVLIQDENDNSPVFEQNHHITSVLEGQIYNTIAIQVFATDADSGINGQIDYAIVTGNENKAFLIDSRHGILSTNAILDREIKSSYRLVLQAADRGTPSLSTSSVVTIQVVDINDNAPTFPPLQTVLLAEDTAPGYTVTHVSANDVDLRPTLSYNFTEDGNPGMKFAINRHSGAITLVASLDYEKISQHYLRIQASDSVHQTEAEITIEVLDVNDNPPLFTQDSYKVTVPELTASDTFVISVSATDRDSERYGPISYRILSPLKGFAINSTSGSVYTDMPVAIQEKSTVFKVLIEAKDNGNPTLASTAHVEILVDNVNNYAPKFSETVYNISVREDASMGEAVLTFTATDLDWTHANAYIDFSIISGNAHNLFSVESSEVLSKPPYVVVGKLVINGVLDRETVSTHSLVILATDQGFPPLNSSATVLICILDSNDNPPVFSNMEYHIGVSENHPVSSVIIMILATDCDIGDNAYITYSIVSGNDRSFFSIDGQNGTVTLAQPLDYEEAMKHTLTLQAIDGWGSKQNVAFSVLFITVLDENDFSPKFLFNSLNYNIYENVHSFSRVCTVNAIDLDSGPYGVLSYSIQSSCLHYPKNEDIFFIDSLTGDLYTKHKIDYEMQKRYCLIVQAKDESESTACVLVYIDIEGEDEFQPIFNQDHYLFDLPKENKAGQVIGKVDASDRDDGLDGVIHYFLEKPSQFFSINITNGMIYLTRSVQKKRSNTKKNDEIIELCVKAHGPKFDSKSATCTVRVNISTSLEGYPGMSANILSISFSISFVFFLLLAISLIGIILRYKRKDVVNACGIKEIEIPALPQSNRKDNTSDHCPKYENIKTCVAPDTSEWLGLVGIREKKDTGNKCRNSDSSGHGSTEGETAEDEEIKMINEYPIRKESGSVLSERTSRVPDSGIPRDSDLLSCESDETGVVISTESTESIDNFKDECGEEECDTNFTREKELSPTHHNTERKEIHEKTLSETKRDYIFVPTAYDSRYGSLASLVASDEDLRGSYNWDYLLSWEPRFQTLSSVFGDIGRLKDERMQRHGLPKQKKSFIFPPPLITSVAQPGIRAVPPRMPTIVSGQTFMKYPRSPFFTNPACQPSTMTPSFSPSLSVLTVHTPSASPVLSDTGVTGTSVPTLYEELLTQKEFHV
ncbi:protocadherin-23 isoform X2 [Ascaphus truei]|uniref:protocadherin-23 isoform X2 n=1 Tax=Ascaphus truei TaxID=8439 RepID=UPI003F5A8461